MTGVAVALAVCASAAAAAALAGQVLRPTPRLAPRLRPYTIRARTALGRPADLAAADVPDGVLSGGTLRRLLGPMAAAAVRRLTRLAGEADHAALALRLRQAGLFAELPDEQRVLEYRIRQAGGAVTGAAVFGALAAAVGMAGPVVLLLAGLGLVFGVTRWRGRLDRAIDERRRRLRVELYTVNQLLAMDIRVGGGIVQALQRTVARGRGAVVTELADVLALHRAGRRLHEALDAGARLTPEPHAARTYRLLAAGAQYGADLADGLLSLSDDLRDERAEDLRRAATKRRAAMLVPIIAILAPVMLLFVAAPLPSIVFAGR